MSSFLTALTEVVTADALWGVITAAAAFIGMSILFGFGVRILRRVTRKLTKGTGGF